MTLYQEFKSSDSLRRYLAFLQEGFLDNFIYTSIKLSHDYKLPAMKQIEGLSEARIYNLFELGIKAFFEDVAKDKVIKGVIEMLTDWKNKNIGTEISSISYQDIILGFVIRKQALVQYIDYYSPSNEEYMELVQELNKLISHIEEVTIQFFKSDEALKAMITEK